MTSTIKTWWVKSSPLRHGVFTFVAAGIVAITPQVTDWASKHPLEGAAVSAALAFVLRLLQQPRGPKAAK